MTTRTISLPLLLALLLGVIAWSGTTMAAYAGGPTSVLLVNPALERTHALYFRDSTYGRLAGAVGDGPTGGSETPPGVSSGQEVRLTWLIHDMRIWRVDRVHLTRNDGIWVETVVELTGEGDVFDHPASWHRAADDRALTTLLTATGLLGGDAMPTTAPATTAPTTVPAETTSAAAAAPAPSRSLPPAVLAGLGGLVLGAGGCLLLLRRPHSSRGTLTG